MTSIIKNQITAYYYIVQRYANNYHVDFILTDFTPFGKPKEISMPAILINFINSVYSLSMLVEIKEWTHKNLDNSLFWNAQYKLYQRSSEIEKHKKSYINTYK
ncbi:uncharacterized protein LOC105430825 [Pogonomyrmex barbatus]|uniref:Uncharacterized protein LOC105430825 n=1 Tax=Pogonomyrmex barbatus TaxID=144034 RepID=A0A8N1S7Y6_9HYME|nr:uncharacterized protein LOC105430825 [Pogonomyrmex barbatus]